MNSLDVRTTLRHTLTHKQELVRNYQTFAEQIANADISQLYRDFAETEAQQAAQIKDKLEDLT